MELNFVQSSEVFGKNTLAWETEFEATGDFNLHVERNKGGDILVYQRTAGSGYAIVEEFRGMDNKPAIDLDFTSVVYPKFVKIVSESQPTYATVTTDGEITEIKSQSKEVEVTANGTMDITPDAGFAYLNSVKVKTNVATSGEGGGSTSSVEYVAFDSEKDLLTYGEYLGTFAYLVKYPTKIETISLMMVMGETVNDAVAFAICPNAVIDFQGEKKTIKDWASDFGANLDLLPRITKEEFYNLNA